MTSVALRSTAMKLHAQYTQSNNRVSLNTVWKMSSVLRQLLLTGGSQYALEVVQVCRTVEFGTRVLLIVARISSVPLVVS